MSILFGHPAGNPNSHHAALAHYEAGRLEAFCVPWMPAPGLLALLEKTLPASQMMQRFSRRTFRPLAGAPKIQDRSGELRRLVMRASGRGDESLSYEANDWLMRTMRRECRRPQVTVVHSYEDCSYWQFEEAKSLGKACVYDLPIGFYPAWMQAQEKLAREYSDWMPPGGLAASHHVRVEQKLREMELADLVLVPSSFVEKTVRAHAPEKRIARAAYGVDSNFWRPRANPRGEHPLRFIFAGQLSLRKGIPLLLDAWERAALKGAHLELIGLWQLAETRRLHLPANVSVSRPCSKVSLRERFEEADVFVLPSYFEGFPLALLEAMACGLPAIASDAASGPEVLSEATGRVVPCGAIDSLVEALRWFDQSRDRLPQMSLAARLEAERWTWEAYRNSVSLAVAPFL
jgi:glycosyltransferase involved in cell wall biosynthesis